MTVRNPVDGTQPRGKNFASQPNTSPNAGLASTNAEANASQTECYSIVQVHGPEWVAVRHCWAPVEQLQHRLDLLVAGRRWPSKYAGRPRHDRIDVRVSTDIPLKSRDHRYVHAPHHVVAVNVITAARAKHSATRTHDRAGPVSPGLKQAAAFDRAVGALAERGEPTRGHADGAPILGKRARVPWVARALLRCIAV
eukprot:scaffold122305_cov35-Tisochrysis_lutea.AAC.2